MVREASAVTMESGFSVGSGPSTRRSTTRSREDNPADLARGCAVAGWRDQHPAGNAEELIAAIGHRFHRDYDVVLRVVLFVVDRHRARQATGITFMGQVP